MKRCLPFSVLLFVAVGLFAQITVTSATFPAAGDTLRMAIDNSPASGIAAITPPGGNQVWDLSSLEAEATQEIIYRSANEGSVGAQVPGAELFTAASLNAENYYNVTDTKFELQAYYGILPYDLVSNNLFEYSPPLAERHAPMNFFDISASSSGFLELFLPSAFSPLLMINLAAVTNNAQIDSMRYRVAISEIFTVDGYGTMSIPGGTFDVLREKRTKYTETRIDCKIPPLGWLDLTDNCIQAGFAGLGVDTTVAFYFHNDVAKEPIAVVTLNNAQNAVTQVVFKNTTPPVADGLEEVNAVNLSAKISPNPVSDEVDVDFKNLVPGTYRMVIFDELGREAVEKTLQVNGGHTERLDLSRLPAGVYFFCVFDENNKALYKEKLVKK
ncbi:MAG: T9SS type A sorting domain-containing protein [Saprospiraceae bacterium]|nr:T9SS type A sorting domain-containing protein [Saprospiraceae bacterium]